MVEIAETQAVRRGRVGYAEMGEPIGPLCPLGIVQQHMGMEIGGAAGLIRAIQKSRIAYREELKLRQQLIPCLSA
jgi:hypothetical protein